MCTVDGSAAIVSATGASIADPPNIANGRRFDWRDYAIYIGFVVIFVLFALLLHDNGFLRGTNLMNIVRQTAIIAVMAVAGTFVIAAAEIDLSIGSVAGLASVVAAMTISSSDSAVLGVLAGVGVGVVAGAINGTLVTLFRMPSFLVTLATLGVAVGIAQWISDFQPEPILDAGFNNTFGSGDIGPFPSLLIWAAVFVAAGSITLNKTSFGRRVLATGGNRIAAGFSGVNTARIKFTVLLASGVVAAIAGLLYAGRLQSGRYQWGTGDELSVIAAVVLGGTSLFGGNGRVVGSLIGALFIGLLNNGLILAGLDASQQRIIQGLIIILAVGLGGKKE
jgi:ribose transport system permease protein